MGPFTLLTWHRHQTEGMDRAVFVSFERHKKFRMNEIAMTILTDRMNEVQTEQQSGTLTTLSYNIFGHLYRTLTLLNVGIVTVYLPALDSSP